MLKGNIKNYFCNQHKFLASSIILACCVSTYKTSNNNDFRNASHAKEFLRLYNDEYAKVFNKVTSVDWTYNTNLTEENSGKA
ncbi:unnamed protein product, partial [Allacma fusca]